MRKILFLFLFFFFHVSISQSSISFNSDIMLGATTLSADRQTYSKTLTVLGSSDGVLTNYPILIEVHKGAGSDFGNTVYLGDKVRDDFTDVRFTKSDKTTKLDYCLESKIDGDVAYFWAEFDSIAADPSTTDFNIHYNDFSAPSIENCDNTFTAHIDYNDAGTFNANHRYITVERPYSLGDVVTVKGSASAKFGNPSLIRLSDGDYVAMYYELPFDNNTRIRTVRSEDDGQTWTDDQVAYDDPTPYLAEPGAFIETVSGTLYAFAKVTDHGGAGFQSIEYGISSDDGVTWPTEASWLTAWDNTGAALAMAGDFIEYEGNYYSAATMSGGSGIYKFDGSNFTITGTVGQSPENTSEMGLAFTGGNNMLLIARHKPDVSDDSTQTLKYTSTDLGVTFSSQVDIADDVGLIQDPDITRLQGSPSDSLLMLHGRLGPNSNLAGTINQEDNVAWFSSDGGTTWTNKTVLFSNTDDTNTDGGYTAAVSDYDFAYIIGWSDQVNQDFADILGRRINYELLNTLELHAYANSVDDQADISISDGSLTKYIVEIKAKAFELNNSENTAFTFLGSGDTLLYNFYLMHSADELRYSKPSNPTQTLYASPSHGTYYIIQAKIDTADTGSEIDYSAFNADRSSTLGTANNIAMHNNAALVKLDVGPDSDAQRSLNHIDFILIRKWTTNEPSISAWGAETPTAYPN